MLTDAGAYKCGGYIEISTGTDFVHCWTGEEEYNSSAWRELKAVLLFLCSQREKLINRHVKLHTDNQSIVHIIRKGSMNLDLNTLALNIYVLCLENDIFLKIDWISRTLNTRADLLSKAVDPDDWSINHDIFTMFDTIYGPFTVDLFANNVNKKCKRFFAKWWCEDCLGVDAFTFNWDHEYCWIVPPPQLIAKTLLHLKASKAKGLLIVPKWKGAPFWPILYSELKAGNLVILKEFIKPSNFFIRGSNVNSAFAEDRCAFDVVALGIRFSYSLFRLLLV